MPFTPQTNIWECAVQQRIGTGQPMVNVFRVFADWDDDPEQVATDCAQAWSDDASFQLYQAAALEYETYTVRRVQDPSLGYVFPGSIGANTTGNVGAAQVAPQVALTVTKLSATGGRKGRGRFYVPGIAVTESESGNVSWDDSDMANLQVAADNFYNLIQLGSSTSALTLPNGDSSDPITVTSLLVRQQYGTQRRRARLGG